MNLHFVGYHCLFWLETPLETRLTKHWCPFSMLLNNKCSTNVLPPFMVCFFVILELVQVCSRNISQNMQKTYHIWCKWYIYIFWWSQIVSFKDQMHTFTSVMIIFSSHIMDKLTAHNRLGLLARSCNPATGRPELMDGVRLGVLSLIVLCRSGVRIKLGINMVVQGEPRASRLSKEGQNGPGQKCSRQKSPCWAVVGLHLRVGDAW